MSGSATHPHFVPTLLHSSPSSNAMELVGGRRLLKITLTLASPPPISSPFFQSLSTRILVHHNCLAFSCICPLFHNSYIGTCLLPHTTLFDAPYSPSSYPLSFLLWPELFTVFPLFCQAMEASRILQSYIHLLSLSLSLFIVSAFASAIEPSSSIAPAFANSSAFTVSSVTNL